MELQKSSHPDLKIPIVLPLLCEGLKNSGGLKAEGIFRISASSSEMLVVRKRIESGDFSLPPNISPYTIGHLLKLWFSELDEPLFPQESYEALIVAAENEGVVNHIVGKMVPLNRRVLYELISLLRLVCNQENHPSTKMGPSNLALVWAPNLFRNTSSKDPSQILQLSKIESQIVALMIQDLDPV